MIANIIKEKLKLTVDNKNKVIITGKNIANHRHRRLHH